MKLNESLLKKYDINGPRYTSYPAAPYFQDAFDADDYARQARLSNQNPLPKPLSLYLHIPFCHSLCYYCGCNKIVTPDRHKADNYLEYLYQEIALQSALYDDDRLVEQIHFGGGTPTFLSSQQLEDVMGVIARHFHLGLPRRLEVGIEVDPRSVDVQGMQRLLELGFNRISMGVQDFDHQVQQAVNRVQSEEQVLSSIDVARSQGVNSISVDLIYGLPKQSVKSFHSTLEKIVALRPDRIALYNYAHMPHKIASQKLINEQDLPAPEEKLLIFTEAVEYLVQAGYVYIGMDHFALPQDALAKGLNNGDLHRNFQGYSTHADCDIVGFGVSAISCVNDTYSQNQRNLTAYMRDIDAGRLPVQHGLCLSADDKIRSDVIQQIMCGKQVDFDRLGDLHHIYFDQYFSNELQALEPLVEDGLVERRHKRLEITPVGRLFLRNIAMVFDAYSATKTHTLRGVPRFSRTV